MLLFQLVSALWTEEKDAKSNEKGGWGGVLVPFACSVLQAAGGNTEHTALVVKRLPQQNDLALQFIDCKQSGKHSKTREWTVVVKVSLIYTVHLRQQQQNSKHVQSH